MKKIVTTISLTLLSILAIPVHAEISGFMSAQSNFINKGESLTKDAPALFGLVTYTHDSGFYIGSNILNVDFGDNTKYEIDYYAGYSLETNGFLLDGGYIYYTNPDSSYTDSSGKKVEYDSNFGEIYLQITKNWFKASIFYGTDTQEMAAINENAISVAFSGTYNINSDLEVTAQLGRQWYDVSGKDEYYYYNATITKLTEIGEIFLTLSDTDQIGEGMKTMFGFRFKF